MKYACIALIGLRLGLGKVPIKLSFIGNKDTKLAPLLVRVRKNKSPDKGADVHIYV